MPRPTRRDHRDPDDPDYLLLHEISKAAASEPPEATGSLVADLLRSIRGVKRPLELDADSPDETVDGSTVADGLRLDEPALKQ